MAYISRDIRDRVATDDDIYILDPLGDDRYRLIPDPTLVVEPGTDINKFLLQLMEDRIVWLMNRIFDNISANPFNITFENLDGLSVTGIWNVGLLRIEC